MKKIFKCFFALMFYAIIVFTFNNVFAEDGNNDTTDASLSGIFSSRQ